MIKPKNKVYELTANFTYKDVIAPRGFTTDGVTAKIRFFPIKLSFSENVLRRRIYLIGAVGVAVYKV